jgi:hypothetical protein
MDLSGIRRLAIHLFTTTSVLHFKWSDGEIINANELSRNINKVPNSQIKIGRLVQSLLKNLKQNSHQGR